MTSKTPVTILQEMMTQMGTVPRYDLIVDGSGTHTPLFKYKVDAGNVSAIGHGRSKKEAKHDAARVALERLSSHQIEDSQSSQDPVEMLAPYKNKLHENAIGELHDMCATNDIPLPEYQLVEESGAPHDKEFVFRCSISRLCEIGNGRTKKQAKQLAAYNMMNRLKESLKDVLIELKNDQHVATQNEGLKQAIDKYMLSIRSPHRKVKLNRNLGGYTNYLYGMPEEYLDAAVNVFKDIYLPRDAEERKGMEVDWMLQLQRVTECLNVETMVVPGRWMKNGNQCIHLQIDLSNEAVFVGSGENIDEALQDAAFNALIFLEVQLRTGKKTS